MAKFKGTILTSGGRQAFADALAGEATITFRKILLSDQEFAEGEAESAVDMSYNAQVDVSSVEAEDNLIHVKGAYNNDEVEYGYMLNSIGLMADVSNQANPVLICVSVAENPDFVPTPETNTYGLSIDQVIVVDSTANIELFVAGSVYATQSDLNGKMDKRAGAWEGNFVAFDGLGNSNDSGKSSSSFDEVGAAGVVMAALNDHAANGLNPHAVTAAQAGADPVGTAANKVQNHNISLDAHPINRFNLLGAVDDDDYIAVWSTATGENRKVKMSDLKAYINGTAPAPSDPGAITLEALVAQEVFSGQYFKPDFIVKDASDNDITDICIMKFNSSTGDMISDRPIKDGDSAIYVEVSGYPARNALTGGGEVVFTYMSGEIYVTPPTKTVYLSGETFDPTGCSITAGVISSSPGYSDFTSFTLAADLDNPQTGEFTYDRSPVVPGQTSILLTMNFHGKMHYADADISVTGLSSIYVSTPPTKTQYNAGEDFDNSGMVIKAVYQDDSERIVTGYSVSPKVLGVGTTAVTISYSEGGVTKTTTQAVTVTNTLTGITIVTAPDKVSYFPGDLFDPSGMVVQASYAGSGPRAVTGYTYPTTGLVAGTTSVTISYSEGGVTKTTTQAITVLNVSNVFAENTWEVIHLVSQAGRAASYWNLGDTKTFDVVKENGTTQTKTATIVNFNPGKGIALSTDWSSRMTFAYDSQRKPVYFAQGGGSYGEMVGRSEIVYNDLLPYMDWVTRTFVSNYDSQNVSKSGRIWIPNVSDLFPTTTDDGEIVIPAKFAYYADHSPAKTWLANGSIYAQEGSGVRSVISCVSSGGRLITQSPNVVYPYNWYFQI